MGTAIAFAMPTKTYDSSTFNKIFIRSLRMINLGLFFNFFGKIQFFDFEGTPLMIIRLLITARVSLRLKAEQWNSGWTEPITFTPLMGLSKSFLLAFQEDLVPLFFEVF